MSLSLRSVSRVFARSGGARSTLARAFSAETAPAETPDEDTPYGTISYWLNPNVDPNKVLTQPADDDASIPTLEYDYDEENTIVVKLNDEKVWVPDVARSIEWVLSSPTDVHLFNETPVIKETTE